MNTTQEQLIKRGIEHAEGDHFRRIPMKRICREIGKSHTLVFHYYGTARAFQDAVMQYAVDNGNLRVIAQGLAEQHPFALAATGAVKKQALKMMLG